MTEENPITAVLRSVDAGDVDAFAEHLAPDVEFRFGNTPAVQGAQAVRVAVEQFLGSIRDIAHEVTDAWRFGDAVAAHGNVTYSRLDGSVLVVPFALVCYLQAERIRDYRIFVDISAL